MRDSPFFSREEKIIARFGVKCVGRLRTFDYSRDVGHVVSEYETSGYEMSAFSKISFRKTAAFRESVILVRHLFNTVSDHVIIEVFTMRNKQTETESVKIYLTQK